MINSQAFVHPGAIIGKNVVIDAFAYVSDTVVLGDGCYVGPFAYIGPNVTLGAKCQINAHAVIKGPSKIDENNVFYQFCSIGEASQDKKYVGEVSWVEIGKNNIFREGCTVHRGTAQGRGITKIGNNNLFMVDTHVAHNCCVGDFNIFANNSSISGHVTVADFVNFGGFSGVHQFCAVGSYSFIAAGGIVLKDVMPYIIVAGSPAKAKGINVVGLERNNFSATSIAALKKAYKIIFRTSHTVQQAMDALNESCGQYPELQLMQDFLLNSARGIVR